MKKIIMAFVQNEMNIYKINITLPTYETSYNTTNDLS